MDHPLFPIRILSICSSTRKMQLYLVYVLNIVNPMHCTHPSLVVGSTTYNALQMILFAINQAITYLVIS